MNILFFLLNEGLKPERVSRCLESGMPTSYRHAANEKVPKDNYNYNILKPLIIYTS